MALIVKRRSGGTMGKPPKVPPHFTPPPSSPPPGWEKRWKFQDALNKMNPTLSLTAAEVLSYTRKDANDTKKELYDDAADVAKKKARVAAIIAANRAKRKGIGAKRNVSGTGTVSPILSSYSPSSGVTETTAGTGFSFSDIPSIVWIILAVAGGIFLIKSAGKRRR